MSISAEEKVFYLREAAIVLAKEGFQLDEVHTDRLCILLDGSPLCEVTGSGGVAYRNEDAPQPRAAAPLRCLWGITERSNFRRMRPEDYPILSDLYDLIEEEFKSYDPNAHLLYTEKLLQEVLLGLHSMCKGADAQFFNGHTNITSSRFLVFGVKGMLSAAKNVRNAMLFNVLSFMSDMLLTVGNTVAALDELYIWLSNPTTIEYIRNCLKRVRKKESAMLLASQNLEDFDQEGIREMTKPLFSIPPHQFLFNAGSIDKRSYMEMLQLDEAEYNLIKFPQRGVCLYKCGNERYLLEVHAPSYKEKLFGTAGGR